MSKVKTAPVFLGFFIMGFVDMVGTAASYVKADFHLNDKQASILPLMVFVWFAIVSLPVGMRMNEVGRRKTVLLGLALTFISLLIPCLHYNLPLIILSFVGLGIGNVCLQVSLNALLSDVITADKLGSGLTGGQLIKSVASFLGPILLGVAASVRNWQLVFPLLAFITLINCCWLMATPVYEQKAPKSSVSFAQCFALLKEPVLLKILIGVMCIVGIDVGINTILPKLVIEKTGWSLAKASLATSIYFISRMVGSLAGVLLMRKESERKFFIVSVILGIISAGLLILTTNVYAAVLLIVCAGLGVSNIFPLLFSRALQQLPQHKNEVAGLLIMGVSGGALFLPVIGAIADYANQATSLLVVLVLWGWLAYIVPKRQLKVQCC